MKRTQQEIRKEKEHRVSLKRPAKPVIGNRYYGLPPVGETGWVHGRIGVLVLNVQNHEYILQSAETGEKFSVPQIYKPSK